MDWDDDKIATSWDELVALLHEEGLIPHRENEGGHFRSKYVFRGMSNATWRMKTSLQRTGSPPHAVEGPLLRSLRKYSPPTAFYRNSSWELLSTAQHNGLPTRVLDWSISPLIACHFATDEWEHRNVDGVVWCVDATALKSTLPDQMQETLDTQRAWIFDAPMLDEHYQSLQDFDGFHQGDFVTMFEPPSIDPRITSQFGVLSVANGPNKFQDEILHAANQRQKGLVKRIIIKASIKGQVRDMLDQNNINERIIYPGLPGLCSWLKRYYSPAYDAVPPAAAPAPPTLYYWSAPFRGQFVRGVLAFAGKTWDEAGDDAIGKLMGGPVQDMPVPFMGPPLLVDHKADVAIAEMPAIILYLGETLDLLPKDPALKALTLKVACDANDVIDELTLDGGRQMWTAERWKDFEPRLEKWMSFWEETGRRHGLKADSGFLLGGDAPGIADVVTAVLWSTITERFERIGQLLDKTAPHTAALVRRVADLPPLAALAAKAREDYGDTWCGGQIEASLRKVLDA